MSSYSWKSHRDGILTLNPREGKSRWLVSRTQGRKISVCQRPGLPISNMHQVHGSKLLSKEIGICRLASALAGHDWESSVVLTTEWSCSEGSGREVSCFNFRNLKATGSLCRPRCNSSVLTMLSFCLRICLPDYRLLGGARQESHGQVPIVRIK